MRKFLTALLVCAFTGLGVTALAADDRPHPVIGVFCDTADQVARFAELLAASDEIKSSEAVEAVNKEVDTPYACVIDHVLQIRGDYVRTVQSRTALGDIHHVTVLGVIHPERGLLWLTEPMQVFSMFKSVKEGT